MNKTVLVTGSNGFTGKFLVPELEKKGYSVVASEMDLTDPCSIDSDLTSGEFDYLVHLAAISSTDHQDISEIYAVNTIATDNLLGSIQSNQPGIKKVILASSASVYGSVEKSKIDEDQPVSPQNHYGCSKANMEFLSRNYPDLPIVITRPFNYTGRGQSDRFLIPKLVNAFKAGADEISLGNTDSVRSFTDVRFVSQAYAQLLGSNSLGTYNLCSSQELSVDDILGMLGDITSLNPTIKIDPRFVRPNDIKRSTGSNQKLLGSCPSLSEIEFRDTLDWMLGE